MAPCFAISRAPRARAIVTVAPRPSGTAASDGHTHEEGLHVEPRTNIAPVNKTVTATPTATMMRASPPTRR